MVNKPVHTILCGITKMPAKYKNKPSSQVLQLLFEGKDRNVFIGLPHFIKTVNCFFSNRVKDLLEIAGYVYAADRMISRGETNQLEYHNWSRDLHFVIKVRDINFWSTKRISQKLSEFLNFVSG
jgi:hypothetical protein